jgi:hypothetical protein
MTKIQGEGDYVSGRRFQEEERRFAQSGRVEAGAREAADALGGPEAEELEAARRQAAEGDPKAPKTRQPRAGERAIDESLEHSFPASDPAPASRGSN